MSFNIYSEILHNNELIKYSEMLHNGELIKGPKAENTHSNENIYSVALSQININLVLRRLMTEGKYFEYNPGKSLVDPMEQVMILENMIADEIDLGAGTLSGIFWHVDNIREMYHGTNKQVPEWYRAKHGYLFAE